MSIEEAQQFVRDLARGGSTPCPDYTNPIRSTSLDP